MGATLIDAMDNEYRTDETLSCNPGARRALRFGLNSSSLLFPIGIVIRFFSSGEHGAPQRRARTEPASGHGPIVPPRIGSSQRVTGLGLGGAVGSSA